MTGNVGRRGLLHAECKCDIMSVESLSWKRTPSEGVRVDTVDFVPDTPHQSSGATTVSKI